MSIATLTSKGQTTIPKDIREHLRLKPGDRMDFVIDDSGRVVLRAAQFDVGALKGMLKRKNGRRLSVDQMNDAIATAVAARK